MKEQYNKCTALNFNNVKNSLTLIFTIVILLIGVFCFFQSYSIVESGTVGIRQRLGKAQNEPLMPGIHFKIPMLDQIIPINTRLINTKTAAPSASKDLQNVRTEVAVQYSINSLIASQIFQRIGNAYDIAIKIIEPAIQESVKAVTARYTAEQIVIERSKVKVEIQEKINKYINIILKNKDIENALTIANVAITDFDFSVEFNKAIELKVKAEQEALQAKNEKIKRVTQAEASAEEKKLSAEANAYQIQLASKAEAEANAYKIELTSKAKAEAIKRETEALKNNPELIQLRIAEKWDGKLPTYTAGKDTIPMLKID